MTDDGWRVPSVDSAVAQLCASTWRIVVTKLTLKCVLVKT